MIHSWLCFHLESGCRTGETKTGFSQETAEEVTFESLSRDEASLVQTLLFESLCSHRSCESVFIVHVILLVAVIKLSLECLQCESDDPWHTAVE